MLELRGIDKHFGGVHALRGVDFSLAHGEVHALLGENGAGKSTLIKILSGIHRPDAGGIALDGETVRIDTPAKAQALGIQTVHQELELAGPLSVAENLFMGRLPCRAGMVDLAAMRREAARALRVLGSAIDPDVRVDQLGIGDKQVIEISRALLRKARILIMDEPTAALPPREVDQLFRAIAHLRQVGTAVIYVSHRLEEVLAIADRITVLRDGQLVATMSRSEADRPLLIRHILGRDFKEYRADLVRGTAEREILVACAGLASQHELTDLSFELYRGEVLGFFGLLGAGQGAVADAMFGLRPASTRSFRMGGIDGLPRNPRAALRRGAAYVPADRKAAGLALGLSVRENLLMPSMHAFSRWGVLRRAKARERAKSLIARYGIRCASAEQRAGDLSGGNQQKVSVAKWSTAAVLTMVLDEPTRGVDVGARGEIYQFMRSFADTGGAVVIASSDPAEIAAVCDRAIVLRQGRNAAEFTAPEMSESMLLEAAL